ncbi:hypothetical protein [Legionella rowbothamii]|uniref:hypothetical protein n=1 Tax=Legionella rowbothamii TaxID=96229 RepID=UPI00105461B4|nr:hypothetical protein [Legionella rowbothamii]
MVRIIVLVTALLNSFCANAFTRNFEEIAVSVDALATTVSYLADMQSNYQCQIKLGSTSIYLGASRDCLYAHDISCGLEGTNYSLKNLQLAEKDACDRQVAIQISIYELKQIIKELENMSPTEAS